MCKLLQKITVYFSSYKTNVDNVVLTRTDSEFEYRTPESYVLKYCKPGILLLYRDYSDIKNTLPLHINIGFLCLNTA